MGRFWRDDATIEYTDSGQGEATLIFVHGSYLDQDCWREQVSRFQAEYRVITLDLPGHGKSGRGRKQWSVQGFAQDVAALIKKTEAENVILIGHSLGADVTLIEATLHPQSIIGFVGIDIFKNAAMPLPDAYQGQVQAILDNLKTDFAGTNEQYARMALLTPKTPPELADRVIAAFRGGYAPMGEGIMPEVFALYRLERELLPRLKPKLYLINVEYIPTNEEPLKQYARHGFEVVRIPGTCHYPMLENPAALNEALGRVFRNIRQDSAVPA